RHEQLGLFVRAGGEGATPLGRAGFQGAVRSGNGPADGGEHQCARPRNARPKLRLEGRAAAVQRLLEARPGHKLYLQSIKLKADPVGWWDTPWPDVAILVAVWLLF